ncbi:MAG: tetratricopeptide repeat protein [Planctomycetota bacterium]
MWKIVILILLLASPSLAQQQVSTESVGTDHKAKLAQARRLDGRKVVVCKDGASFHVPDGPTIDAQIGYLYKVDKIRDSWLWVVRTGGWIEADQVVAQAEAEAHFTDILKKQPSADAYYHRGVMRSVEGQYNRAFNDYEAALRLQPEMAKAFNGLGNCLWATGKVYEALEQYRQAIAADPKLAAAYNNRGNAWRTLGDHEAALKDYNQALTVAGEVALILNNRGSTHLAMGNLNQAVEDYSRAILVDSHYSDAFNNRGFVMQMQGDFEKAIANYRRAAQYDPQFFRAVNNAAWLRATCPDDRYRDGQLAVQSAQQACELTDYKLWFCLATLAAAHAEAGDSDMAVQSQLKAISLMPANLDEIEWDEQAARLELYREKQPYRAKDYSSMARTLKRALQSF